MTMIYIRLIHLFIFLQVSTFGIGQVSENIQLFKGGADITLNVSSTSDEKTTCEYAGSFDIIDKCNETRGPAIIKREKYIFRPKGSTNVNVISISGGKDDYSKSLVINPIEEFSTIIEERYEQHQYSGLRTKECLTAARFNTKESCTDDGIINSTVLKSYTITIENQPQARTPSLVVCRNSPAISLFNNVDKPGGFFEINGGYVDGSNFNASNYTAGIYNVAYKKIYKNGITVANFTLQIFDKPEIVYTAPSSICSNSPSFDLATALKPNPSGGTWSLNGSSLYSFDPSRYSGIQNVQYTAVQNGCSSIVAIPLTVAQPTALDLVPVQELCSNGASVALVVSPSPWLFDAFGGYIRTGKWTTTNSAALKTTNYYRENDSIRPRYLNIGDNVFTYEYINSEGCTSKASTIVKVNDTTKVSLDSPETLCLTGSVYDLAKITNLPGTWTGRGITASTFNPAIAGVSKHNLLFTHLNAKSCISKNTTSIEVLPAVTSFIGEWRDEVYCTGSDPIDLNKKINPYPGPGVWTGRGVTNNFFDSKLFTPGTKITFTYTYTSQNGCSGTKTKNITVQQGAALPRMTPITVCKNDKTIALTANPPSWSLKDSPFAQTKWIIKVGSFSGPGVTTNVSGTQVDTSGIRVLTEIVNGNITLVQDTTGKGFHLLDSINPAKAKSGQLSYTYLSDGGCKSTIARELTVVDTFNIAYKGEEEFCVNALPIDLGKLAGIEGGIWQGKGVTNNILNPALAGVGNASYLYTYKDKATGCTSRKIVKLAFKSAPEITGFFTDKLVCKNTDQVNLYLDISPVPFSGQFTGGAGLRGGNFVPAETLRDTNIITYKVTDNLTSCSQTKTRKYIITHPDVITLPDSRDLCTNSPAAALEVNPRQWSIESGRSVKRGTWAGQRIRISTSALSVDSIFPYLMQPSEYDYIYTYINSKGCVSKDTITIAINDTTRISIGSDTSLCRNAAPINLFNLTSIKTGQFSYKGKYVNQFFPKEATAGDNIIVYKYVNRLGCTSTARKNFFLKENPLIKGPLDTTISVCRNQGLINLIQVGFQPRGGKYEGNYISDNKLNPLLASTTSTIKYTALIEGCASETFFSVKVNNEPTVRISEDLTVCKNDPKIELYASPFINPLGLRTGRWSGLGVVLGKEITSDSVNATNLKVGTDSLFYTYTDENRCTTKKGIKLTIDAAPTAVITSSKLSVQVGEEVQFLSNAKNTDKYLWEFGDGDISFEKNPWHFYYMVSDTLTVRLTVESAAGCKASVRSVKGQLVVVGERYRPVTSQEELNFLKDGETVYAEFYPQPFANVLQGKVYLREAGSLMMTITNSLGQVVYSQSQSIGNGLTTLEISTDSFSQGMYQVHLFGKSISKTFKIVKQ